LRHRWPEPARRRLAWGWEGLTRAAQAYRARAMGRVQDDPRGDCRGASARAGVVVGDGPARSSVSPSIAAY